MKYGLTDQDLNLIITACKSFPTIKSAILFGSRALGNFKKGSDVDIALKGKLDHAVLSQFKDTLSEQTSMPYFFDVIDYSSIENESLKQHIDEFGIDLYPKQPS